MATMEDIAKSLGISKATVSKALSGADDISETMRKSVVERAVELGYSRVSRSGVTKRLCVFVFHMKYETQEDFGYDLILGFRMLAKPAGYTVDVVSLSEVDQTAITFDEYMLMHDYEGALFLALSNTDPWMEQLACSHCPAVLYDNPSRGNPTVTQVGVDNREAMRMAVEHLCVLGHQRIGYLGSGDPDSFIYEQRHAAFFDAMRSRDLPADPEDSGFAACSADCIREHLPRLLSRGCTAIICNHDLMAQALLTHCAETHISVPEELSVVGFDDLPISRYTVPPLTTVRQDRVELGKSAFYALTSQMNGTHIGLLLLHATLTLRGSTGRVKAQ